MVLFAYELVVPLFYISVVRDVVTREEEGQGPVLLGRFEQVRGFPTRVEVSHQGLPWLLHSERTPFVPTWSNVLEGQWKAPSQLTSRIPSPRPPPRGVQVCQGIHGRQ